MRWWPWSNQTEDQKQQQQPQGKADGDRVLTNYSRGQKILLEDTPPKFADDLSNSQLAKKQERATLKEAWDSIRWSDFSLQKLTSIPCFRDAGMLGFSSMFLMGSIIFIYHKSPTKATNWAMSSLILGSIVGWEQCRLKRQKSFQIAQLAKETVAKKEKPMLHNVPHDPSLPGQWEAAKNEKQSQFEQSNQNLSQASSEKKWYKFW
ncbi:Cox20p [Saccharomyces cerevisiae YJM1573]|uniref:Cytochrome c oxidase assembly protein COX20, mitochondrial n=2 Tax=Saccharomyces cerevisiae TaxID=4932 RepID=COX20_YEAST|nr:Cox20p [Saccharomyces cerevisiae S288C]Q04935.1 RecName: Full=Cytochrome c oxidase assembly protein COX20, mitochondrial; Flags: Precursor [Saccharomyces cerevisiae S288C]AAS56057.1 YDR231C [Saccharomyces cerevisiae]AJU59449.1 Cox20p [Saccharomyces cerevisiae YJM195]AJU67138.1 Cox20p [Saccharomyces cerevisiae YJM456]AJU70665.1 Cox20p [Saccharomyces cerevisiae YJM627]AJU81185.1 Cox20p [Saccharomyces cerevisiae YJM1083]AJU85293.1 Cox20p [Saccharomyces cerevisiae YJM1208]AJU87342.1 Cox20p [|eukprot:NP_010517.1 Cox20p [Saccharomyces cerevisiae S288C]